MKYLNHIYEELSISDLNHKNLNKYIDNLLFRLGEYESYIVEDAEKLKSIDVKIIIRELRNEFTDEFIKELKLTSFILNINEILRQDNKHSRRLVINTFKRYYAYLENIKKDKVNKEIESIKGFDTWKKYVNKK
jgi:hypothetical protein